MGSTPRLSGYDFQSPLSSNNYYYSRLCDHFYLHLLAAETASNDLGAAKAVVHLGGVVHQHVERGDGATGDEEGHDPVGRRGRAS
eukprot:1737332-Prymnesium_polylepis.1